jgi:hypothetical protein
MSVGGQIESDWSLRYGARRISRCARSKRGFYFENYQGFESLVLRCKTMLFPGNIALLASSPRLL